MGRHEKRKVQSLPFRKRIKLDWMKNNVAIETRYTEAAATARTTGANNLYNHENKAKDEVKDLANTVLCSFAADLQKYFQSILRSEIIADMRYLVLDGLYLGTTTRLVKECGAALSNVYICSKEIEFRSGNDHNKINSYTGRLVDYLRTLERDQVVFHVLYLDFCGNFSKENYQAVELLFEKQLLAALGIIAITLSYRFGTKSTAYNRQHTFGGLMKFKALALKHGYYIGTSEPVENVKHGMCTYVCKFLNFKEACDHKSGFNLDDRNLGPDNWANRNINIQQRDKCTGDGEYHDRDDYEENENYDEDEENYEDEDEDDYEDDENYDDDDEDEDDPRKHPRHQDDDHYEEKDENYDDDDVQKTYRVGDDVSVRLTGLLNFSGFRNCHMDGKIVAASERLFHSLYEVHLHSINHTVRVHRDRLAQVRSADIGRKWKKGDSVQVNDEIAGEWWEASILSYNAKTKLYKIEWAGYGNTADVSADQIRE
jgi:hypothetical protein